MNITKSITFLTILTFITSKVYQISKPHDPLITWSNIDFLSPEIIVYFQTDAKFSNPLQNFWIMIALPFKTINADIKWSYYSSCQLDYQETISQRIDSSEGYSNFYIQLKGALLTTKIFAIKILPEEFIKTTGFSQPFQIKLISSNDQNHIIYSQNTSFFIFYSLQTPKKEFQISIKSENCQKLDFVCSAFLQFRVEQKFSKLVVVLLGDYFFAANAEITCLFSKMQGLNYLKETDYSCSFEGSRKRLEVRYSGGFQEGLYEIQLNFQTPLLGGLNSLSVFSMNEYDQNVQQFSQIDNFTRTSPFTWKYPPKIMYSLGFDPAETGEPKGFGLMTMQSGYQQVFNTMRFTFLAEALPNFFNSEDNFELQLLIGTVDYIIKMETVNHNFQGFPNKKVTKEINGDRMSFKNVKIRQGQLYYLELSIGFTKPQFLDKSQENGFGVIQYLHQGELLVRSRAAYRQDFNNVIDNKNILQPETFIKSDNYYKGYSSVRSDEAVNLGNNQNDFYLKFDKSELKEGENQVFYLQSMMSPTHLYTQQTILNSDDGERVVLDIIIGNHIYTKKTNFEDDQKDQNCRIFIGKFQVWNDQVTKAMAQEIFDDTNFLLITQEPSDYNPLGGCVVMRQQYQGREMTILRMRFKTIYFADQHGTAHQINGANLIFFNQNDMSQNPDLKGNIYLWNGIDIARNQLRYYSDPQNFQINDIIIRLFLFSNLQKTSDEIEIMPSLVMMDSYRIKSKISPLGPLLSMSLHNIHYKRSGNDFDLDNELEVPMILVISGQFQLDLSEVYLIEVELDFLEPLVKNDKIDCQSQNLSIFKCLKVSKSQDFIRREYKDYQYSFNQIYAHSSGSVLDIYLKGNTGNQDFSLIIPVKIQLSINLKTYLANNAHQLKTYPLFSFYDNSLNLMASSDFSENFNLLTFSTSYETPWTIFTSTTTAGLDDPSNSTKPNEYSYIESNGKQMSSYQNINLIYQCQSCTQYPNPTFSTLTFCSSQNFFIKDIFEINLVIADPLKIYQFSYEERYCIVIPELMNGLYSVPFNNFLMPSQNALKFNPKDTIMFSSQIPIYGLKLSELSGAMTPNLIELIDKNLKINKLSNSITFKFEIKLNNQLKKGQYLILRRVTGPFLFLIRGQSTQVQCRIQNEKICFFTIDSQQIMIEIYQDILQDNISVILYGLSVDQYSGNDDLELEVMSVQDNPFQISQVINSSLPKTLKIIYEPPKTNGTFEVKELKITPNIPLVYAQLEFMVELKDRQVKPTDKILIHFGQSVLMEETLCQIKKQNQEDFIQAETCQVANSKEVYLKFQEDFDEQEFRLILVPILAPVSRLPGIMLYYIFNGQYSLFNSDVLYYPESLVTRNIIISQEIEIQKNFKGFNKNFLISLTLSENFQPNSHIYLIFNGNLSSTFSYDTITAYEDNFSFWELNTWQLHYGCQVISNFQTSIEKKKKFTLKIENFNNFDLGQKMYLIVSEGENFREIFGLTSFSLQQPQALNTLPLINIVKSSFSNKILRDLTDLSLTFLMDGELSYNQNLIISFPDLFQELSRPVDLTVTINQVTHFYKLRNNSVIIKLKENFPKEITLQINNLPTPDNISCISDSPSILLLNSQLNKILQSSSSFSSNFNRNPFVQKKGIFSLFLETQEIQRGFVQKVLIDQESEHYLLKELNYELVNTLNGLFLAEPTPQLNIYSFSQKVGLNQQQICLGAISNTNPSSYNLFIQKQEFLPKKYSNLPFLRVNITDQKAYFKILEGVNTVKGGLSLPIIFGYGSPLAQEVNFKLFILDNDEIIKIEKGKDEFTLSQQSPYHLLQFSCIQDTLKEKMTVLIETQPDEYNSPLTFPNTSLTLRLIPQITYDPQVILSVRELSQNHFYLDISSNQEIAVWLVIQKKNLYRQISVNLIENFYLQGITSNNGLEMRMGVIYDREKLLTFLIDQQEADREYSIDLFYQGVDQKERKSLHQEVKTLGEDHKIGQMILQFEFPQFIPQRRQILCKLCQEYGIVYGNFYEANGINCNPDLDKKFKSFYHIQRETFFNSTISEMNEDQLKEQTNILKLNSMKITLYSSLKVKEKSDLYQVLFGETRKVGIENLISEIVGVKISSVRGLVKHFINENLSGSLINHSLTNNEIKLQFDLHNVGVLAVLNLKKSSQFQLNSQSIQQVSSFENFDIKESVIQDQKTIIFKDLKYTSEFVISYAFYSLDMRDRMIFGEVKNINFETAEEPEKTSFIVIFTILIYLIQLI